MVTIILLVSRPHFLQKIFAQLDLMPCDRESTSFFVYVDGDHSLYEKARNFTVNSKFTEKLCVFRKKGTGSVSGIKQRRQRIAEIHNEIKSYLLKGEYILLLEDDTLFPLNTMEYMLKNATMDKSIGIFSAVELGRWGFTMIGAWKADDVYNTKKLESIPEGEGIVEVDATGLFCGLMRKELYLQHTFQVPEAGGPDINLGLWLRQQGYKNYATFDLKCKHLIQKGEITFFNSEIHRVQLSKDGDTWNQKQL